ncbi:hypothetical protein [Acidovorax kalamii]|uniref:hypothetical protein n=1 Tax=Acidovorax kalamii TaxID=2004485 RepID=UPI0020914DA4|nr:hypothetical protein [Acidovorax kalamii]MCO5356554.1 hypothetical protein [Acidovorax kalamii]
MRQAVGALAFRRGAGHWKYPPSTSSEIAFPWKSVRWHIETIATEETMDTADFDELAGRVEGVSRAVLHIAAALEIAGLIDGPQLAQAWRSALPLPGFEVACRTLQELANALDGARSQRQALAL